MTRRADYQRAKLYRAEDKLFNKSNPPEFTHLQDCKDYAKTIVDSQHWKKHNGWRQYTITDGRGRRSACYKGKENGYARHSVCLPVWSRSRWLIIHEFAHFLASRTHPHTPGHSSIFCGHYVALVSELLGDDVGCALYTHLKEGGCMVVTL